ncbi:hypothetical protein FRC08_015832 [Ceratobasidium sp. 394]|nr:hypothetical protein FRC08_015832 [Ceratobasidium sp. 394]
MPVGALARFLLPLLANVPPDAENPFQHAPFIFPTFRANMNLCPMATDEQLQLYEDESLDVDLENSSSLPVTAGDGLCFLGDFDKWLTTEQLSHFTETALLKANTFYREWIWGEIRRFRALGYGVPEALKRIDLVGPKTVLPEGRTDDGWNAYRQIILAAVDRNGGILDLAKQAMERHRATPAERWRDARDENRRKVDGRLPNEYDVPIPAAGVYTCSLTLLDEIAELTFGPEVVSARGTVDTVYRDCARILAHRAWEKLLRRHKTKVRKSRSQCAEMDKLLADARESGAVGDLMAALRLLQAWRPTAEATLESDDEPFLSRERELGKLFRDLGHEGELEEAAGKAKGKKRGVQAGVRKLKSGSLVPSEAEIAAALEHWNDYCQSLQDDRDCPVPLGSVRPRFDLLEPDGDQDIGMDELASLTPEELWTSLGLPGASQFPFAEPGGPTKQPARPRWHQVAGVLAILKRAFTGELGQSACPTMLCDDVGLGKTLQIIGTISTIAHMREQQERRADKVFVPPPFAVEAETPYFAGLERIPNRPSLIVVPNTLSSQWMEQLRAFTELGSFHILRFSNDQGSLARYFSDPKGEYMKAAGPNYENASKVIILAETSAIATELGRCFVVPRKRATKEAQRLAARADPNALRCKSDISLKGTIWDMLFNVCAYDESQGLRNVSLPTLSSIKLSAKALVRIGATATPIFTGPKDVASQGRALQYQAVVGDAGEKLHDWLLQEQQARANEWEGNEARMLENLVASEAWELANMYGREQAEARMPALVDQLYQKYESPDQQKILKAGYVMQTSIARLRELMLPIVLRRSGTSKDYSGKNILDLRPYATLTGWSPVKECEQAELDRINEVQREQLSLRRRRRRHDDDVLKWSNFLLTQKDAHMHHEIPRLKEAEKEPGVPPGSLTEKIGDDWNEQNLAEKASTRLLKTDELIEHFWEGNPKPPVYREDGTRDLEAEARQEDPPPLDRPRKFLVYVQYKLHRVLLKKVLRIRGRGFVEYDGTMSRSKREAAIAKFQNDEHCRIMLISNVGSAGLNLTAASIVIFVSGVWSGQERMQIIGRAWRFGQTCLVIVIDIIAPRGLDLALAGYAGAKTVMSETFLRSERALNQAHKAVMAFERQCELGPDEEDEDDEEEDAPLADLPQPKKSRVTKRKPKNAAGEGASGDDEPVPPPAKKRRSKAKDVGGTDAKKGRSRKAAPQAEPTGVKSSAPSTSSGTSESSLPTESPEVGPIVEEPQREGAPPKKKARKADPPSSAPAKPPTSAPSAKRRGSVLQQRESGPSNNLAIPPPSPPVQALSPTPRPAPSDPPPPTFSSAPQSARPSPAELPQRDPAATTSRRRPQPKHPKHPACEPGQPQPRRSASPDLFDLSRPRATPGSSQGASRPPPSSPARLKAPSPVASVGAGEAPSRSSGALPIAHISEDPRQYTEAELRLATELGFAKPAAPASLTSRRDAPRSKPSGNSSATAGTSSGGASSAGPSAVAPPARRPSAAVPERRSPIKDSDSNAVRGEKLYNLAALHRGTTAPVRTSGKRAHDTIDGGSSAPKSSSAITPNVASRPSAPAVTAPVGSASSASTATAAPAYPPSQDTAQHKRSGFVKRSKAVASQGGSSQRDTRVTALDRRDSQIDKSSSGPRSPSRAPKISMFATRK